MMTSTAFEIQLVAILVAIASALPGVYLVLRRLSLVSDAVSHAVLPGIVIAFLFVHDLASPLLLVAAGITGLLTVILIEALQKTALVREDAAIGLVFPALFSIGVLLIARFASGVHLDTDAVLLGELAFVPFDRLFWHGLDLGPRAAWSMGGILLLNASMLALLYKEFNLSTFDATYAAVLGFMPSLLHYLLMAMVSLTTVGAFHAVGAILVIALMIAPPATAYLLTHRVGYMIGLSIGFGFLAAVLGYQVAQVFDVAIAGAMATMAGVLLVLVWLFAPEEGLVARLRRARYQRMQFAVDLLLVHLYRHQYQEKAIDERDVKCLPDHLNWSPERVRQVVAWAQRSGYVRLREGRYLELTPIGEKRALQILDMQK